MRGLNRPLFGVCSAIAAACGSTAVAAGPDVIVGDLPGFQNYPAAGGIVPMAVATTSCNIGDQALTWIAGNNQHPVISQNIYRLLNGRFEQIGQAWLKHGFCALQGTVCNDCPNPGSCPALEPGCSDPYSSSLNGDQNGLGPKSEVNAFNGSFPYPWVNNGSGSGSTFKRLRAAAADLGNAGAQYFVSSMYVQPEDATQGNGLNNQSYRSCTTNASGITALTGTTQRTKPGIQAWKDADASVTITNVDVPGEGRFIVASKATDLGGDVWHYEYAIQNLNSHRSGQAFSVPTPGGTVVSNVAFHDVDYHSGEPYALTDWTPTVGATSVSWATQTFAQNQNANALRWDTIYNFRFDANVAPGAGTGTITLFRTGTPTTVSGSIVVPGGGPIPPSNNDCANATTAVDGANAFTTVNATTDGPTETLCNSSGSDQVTNDVWFRYTALCTNTVTVNTCGATWDTRIAVYGANCPGGVNTALACNDDAAACGGNGLQSQLTFNSTAGQQYLIRVGGFNGATGAGNLTISHPVCGLVNDACANATNITAYGNTAFDTATSTTDGPTPTTCGTGNQIANDIWYTYTACAAGTHTISDCNATFDSVLAVYTGACGSLTLVGCNDDACGTAGLRSTLTWTATQGTTYRIRIGGYQGATGTGTLVLSGPACQASPPNDLCANAINLTAYGATSFNSTGAGNDGPTPTSCGTGNLIGADIWYTYTTCVAGSHTVDTCTGGNYDSVILVYTGACGSLTEVTCNDDTTGCGAGALSSRATWTATAGTTYRIRVGGYQSATGAGTLTLAGPACPPPGPANNDCANRAGVGSGVTPFDTTGATTDGPNHAGCVAQPLNDIWFNHPSQCPGGLTFSLCGSAYDTVITVYDDAGCTNFEARLLRCNDDTCGLQSRVVLPSTRGRNYTIRIGGFNGATGTGTLTISCCPGDFNGDGNVSSQDIFDFLAAYFSNNPRADFNGSGGNPTSQDIFDFLAAFFTPCP